jgi:uncharacterized membrane protein YfcA
MNGFPKSCLDSDRALPREIESPSILTQPGGFPPIPIHTGTDLLTIGRGRRALICPNIGIVANENLALFLALLTGVSLGSLGGGGSIVTLPILVYVAGIAPQSAVGMSMTIVGGTSLVGSYLHWRRGNFLPKAALLFSAMGIVGAYLGSIGTHLVSSSALMLLFSGLMLIIGTFMLAGRRPSSASRVTCSTYRCIPCGLAVGLVTGFLGVGGGLVIVPALVWFAGLDAKRAIGTSLGIIAVNSAAGLAGQLRFTHWDWSLTGKFLACSLIGMGFGIRIAKRAPDRVLRNAFAIVVLGVAAAIGWQVTRHGL